LYASSLAAVKRAMETGRPPPFNAARAGGMAIKLILRRGVPEEKKTPCAA
jgi:hypothetical protein